MRMITLLVLTISSINLLVGCSAFSGKIIPEKGPTMEDVYDSITSEKVPPSTIDHEAIALSVTKSHFNKISNPALNVYVYSHLGGKDEIPIPGYFTEFNAYEKDHFALPNEIVGT
jgi:uncharacterized protein YcfL